MNKPDYPAVLNGSILFGIAMVGFLIGLILMTAGMPVTENPDRGHLYSEDVINGKAIYDGEGCLACHSRMVRLSDKNSGAPASVDSDMQLTGYPGSSRIGPDLQNIVGRLTASMLAKRLTDPDSLQPETVMPSYSYLGERRVAMLVAYLEHSSGVGGNWDEYRRINNIESAVPDSMLVELVRYFDSDTRIFVAPISSTPEFANTGQGIFDSRCAACHTQGIAYDDVPVEIANLDLDKIGEYSIPMLYWRISDGVPGSAMPSWGDMLSEDAIWFLIGYIRSMAEKAEVIGETEIYPEEMQIEPGEIQSIELPDGFMGVIPNDDTIDNSAQEDDLIFEMLSPFESYTGSASEEEDTLGEMDVDSEDAALPVQDSDLEEDSP